MYPTGELKYMIWQSFIYYSDTSFVNNSRSTRKELSQDLKQGNTVRLSSSTAFKAQRFEIADKRQNSTAHPDLDSLDD